MCPCKKRDRAGKNIIAAFEEAGYEIEFKLLDAVNFNKVIRDAFQPKASLTFNVPQPRKRLIFVGFRQDLNFERKAFVPLRLLKLLKQ